MPVSIRSSLEAEAILTLQLTQHARVDDSNTPSTVKYSIKDAVEENGMPSEAADAALAALAFLERTSSFEKWRGSFAENAEPLADGYGRLDESQREKVINRMYAGLAVGTQAPNYLLANYAADERQMLAATDLQKTSEPTHRQQNLKVLTARVESHTGNSLDTEYKAALGQLYDISPGFVLKERQDGNQFVFNAARILRLAQPKSAMLRSQLDDKDRAYLLDTIGSTDLSKAPAEFKDAAWTMFLKLRSPSKENLRRWSTPGTVLSDFVKADLGDDLNAKVEAWLQTHNGVNQGEWVDLFTFARDELSGSVSEKTLHALYDGIQNILQAKHSEKRLDRQTAILSSFRLARTEKFVLWAVEHSAGAKEHPARIVRDLFALDLEFRNHQVRDPDSKRMVHPDSGGVQEVVADMITQYTARGDIDQAKETLAYALDHFTANDSKWVSPFVRHLTNGLSTGNTPNAEALREPLLDMLEEPRFRTLDSIVAVLSSREPSITEADKEHVFSLVEADAN